MKYNHCVFRESDCHEYWRADGDTIYQINDNAKKVPNTTFTFGKYLINNMGVRFSNPGAVPNSIYYNSTSHIFLPVFGLNPYLSSVELALAGSSPQISKDFSWERGIALPYFIFNFFYLWLCY